MGFYRQPQKVWIRRAMFQIHLWTGIGVGVYITVVCLTGSVLVFRRELTRAPQPTSTRRAGRCSHLQSPAAP